MLRKMKFVLTATLFFAVMLFAGGPAFSQSEETEREKPQVETQGEVQQQGETQSSETQNEAATGDDFAEKHAEDLKIQLNLDESQTEEVKTILEDYKSEVQDQAQGTVESTEGDNTAMDQDENPVQKANEQITEVLDEEQKASFEQVKTSFWAGVNNDVNGSQNGQY